MNKALPIAVLALLVVSCTSQPKETPTRGKAVVAVSRSYAALIEQEANEFQRLYPEAHIAVLPRTTREAIVALLNDSLTLICIDRRLNDEEQSIAQQANLSPMETRIADDAVAIIVHRANPITQMRLPLLQELFLGRKHSWQEVAGTPWIGPIEVAMTGRNSGLYDILVNSFFQANAPLQATHWAESDKEVIRYVATHPRAIGAVASCVLKDSLPSIKTIALESKDPSVPASFVKLHQANIYRGWYPLRFSLYGYSTAPSNSVAAGFVAFLASAPGQKILLNAGLVPATMPVRLVQITRE